MVLFGQKPRSEPPVHAKRIPFYSLYGEGEGATDPGFAHIETIPSRSHLHNWRIAPHSHPLLLQILLLRRSLAEVTIDGETIRIAGPAAISVPPGFTHGFRFDPQVKGDVLSVCPALLASRGETDAEAEALTRTLHEWPAILPLDSESAGAAAMLARQLSRECAERRAGGTAMAMWIVRSLLLLLARRHAELELEKHPSSSRTIPFARFRALVERHFREQHGLGFYAAELGLTERSLNRLATRGTGRSAKAYLTERLVLEARRQLAYTTFPVATIAYELGFDDPSYFSRFYRKATGRLPSEDRSAAP